MKYLLIALSILALAPASSAQKQLDFQGKAGKMYFHWGYNRAFYNRSDLHLKGDGYDITIHEALAYDSHHKWDPEVYLGITKLTIPQFNFRLGYFIKERLSVSVGWDHMKYRLNVPQIAPISGTISPERSEKWQGEYNYERVQLSPDFIRLEHTDGFNFVRVGLEYFQPFWNSRNGKHMLNFMVGGNVGVTLPWTDTYVFEKHSRTQPHLAGWGFSGMSGLRFEFFKHFYFQWRVQYGFTHMGDILIEDGTTARGEQNIIFMERALVGGVYFNVGKKN